MRQHGSAVHTRFMYVVLAQILRIYISNCDARTVRVKGAHIRCGSAYGPTLSRSRLFDFIVSVGKKHTRTGPPVEYCLPSLLMSWVRRDAALQESDKHLFTYSCLESLVFQRSKDIPSISLSSPDNVSASDKCCTKSLCSSEDWDDFLKDACTSQGPYCHSF